MADDKTPGERGPAESGINLDLGLKSIIDTAAKAMADEKDSAKLLEKVDVSAVLKNSADQAAAQLEAKEEGKSSPPQPDPSSEPFDYEGLANKSRWKELGALCERRLAETSDTDVEAKLWWIKSQFASKAIPLTILAPSLDSASQNLVSDTSVLASDPRKGRLAGLTTGLLVDFAKHLQRDKDFELALSFLERAYRADPTVRDSLREIVKQQINAASDTPNLFGQEHSQAVKRLSIELMLSPATKESKAAEAASPSKAPPQRPSPFAGKAKEITVGILTLALLVYAGLQLFEFGGDYLEKKEILAHELKPVMPLEKTSSIPVALAPFPEPLNGLTHLDAVFYDFNNKAGTAPAAVQPAVADRQPAFAADAIAAASLGVRGNDAPPASPADSARLRRETVNTSSPIIAPEFPRAEPDDDRDELPTIDFPPFRQSKSRRQIREEEAMQAGDSAGPWRYVVIARTKVMEEPSYYAYSPADLREGDEIQVEANLGKWLRIRTRRGNVAYVLAQDAAKVNGAP